MTSKDMMGLQLNMNPEYIEKMTKELVLQSVAGVLKTKDGELIKELVNNVLYQQVNEKGEISNYRGDNKQPLINYLVNKLIKDQTNEILIEVLNENQGLIRKKIKTELRKDETIDAFLNAFTKGVTDTLESVWYSDVKVDVKINKYKERY
jgi:hypothetical protein